MSVRQSSHCALVVLLLFVASNALCMPRLLSSANSGSSSLVLFMGNKYSTFSKKQLDPIEATKLKVLQQQQQDEELKEAHKGASRGTTIPTRFGASAMKKTLRLTTTTTTTAAAAASVPITSPAATISPSDPFSFGYVHVGKIQSAHGVKGEVKISMQETDFAHSRLAANSTLYIKKPNRLTPRPITVLSSRATSSSQDAKTFLVHLDHILTRAQADALVSYKVYVKTQDRPALGEDEYLIRDLVGMVVEHVHTKQILGTVVGVVPPEELTDSPSASKLMHAMLEIEKANHGSVGGGGGEGKGALCLVPLVPQIVTLVLLAEKRILLDPPAGLLDLIYHTAPKRVTIRGFLPAQSAYLKPLERRQLAKCFTLLYKVGGQVVI